MKIKKALLAVAVACAAVIPLSACGSTSAEVDSLKNPKDIACQSLERSAVNIIGGEILNYADGSLLPLNPNQSYIDTQSEAYNILNRYPDILAKINNFVQKNQEYFKAAQTLDDLLDTEYSATYNLNEILSGTEYQNVANLVNSINSAKAFMEEVFANLDADEYSSVAYAKIQQIGTKINQAIENQTDYRVLDDLVWQFYEVLTINGQLNVSAGHIEGIEDFLSNETIIGQFPLQANELLEAKALTIEKVKSSITETEMRQHVRDLFETVMKVVESNTQELKEYFTEYSTYYINLLNEEIQKENVQAMPQSWIEKAEAFAFDAKSYINNIVENINLDLIIDPVSEMEEVFDDFKNRLYDLNIEYQSFVDLIKSLNYTVENYENKSFVATVANKQIFNNVVVKVKTLIATAPDSAGLYLGLSNIYKEVIGEPMSAFNPQSALENMFEALLVKYSLEAQLYDVIYVEAYQSIYNLVNEKMDYVYHQSGEYLALYNKVEDICDENFSGDDIILFGAEKVMYIVNEYMDNLEQILIDVYSLTEEEAYYMVESLYYEGEDSFVFSAPKINLDELNEESLELAIGHKIYQNPTKFNQLKTKILSQVENTKAQVCAVNTVLADIVVGAENLLEQINKDFVINNVYDMLFQTYEIGDPSVPLNEYVQEACECLEGIIDEAKQALIAHNYDPDIINYMLTTYTEYLDEIYMAEDSIMNTLPSAESFYTVISQGLSNIIINSLESQYYIPVQDMIEYRDSMFNLIQEIDQNLETEIAKLDIQSKTYTKDQEDLYKKANNDILEYVLSLMATVEENHMTQNDYIELTNTQLDMLSQIQYILEYYGVAFRDGLSIPTDLEGLKEFYKNLTENDLVLQSSAFLYIDLNNEIAVNSYNEMLAVLNNYIDNVVNAEVLEDLLYENYAWKYDLVSDLGKVNTILDEYTKVIISFIQENPFIDRTLSDEDKIKFENAEIQYKNYKDGYGDFYEAQIAIAECLLIINNTSDMLVMQEEMKQAGKDLMQMLDIKNEAGSTLVALTEEELLQAEAFLLEARSMLENSYYIISLDDVLSLTQNNPMWTQLVFNNYYTGVISYFYSQFGVDIEDLDASLAELFEEDDVEVITNAVAEIKEILKRAKYTIYVNDTTLVTESTFVEYLDTLQTELNIQIQTLAMVESKAMILEETKADYVNDLKVAISTEVATMQMKNSTYATVLDFYNTFKNQIDLAEDETALENLMAGFGDAFAELDDKEYFDALAFEAEKLAYIQELENMLAEFEYYYNAENQALVKALIEEEIVNVASYEDSDALSDGEDVFNAALAEIETLNAYYAHANTKIAETIAALQQKTDLDFEEAGYDSLNELVDTYSAKIEGLRYSYESIKAFNDALALLQAEIDALPVVGTSVSE